MLKQGAKRFYDEVSVGSHASGLSILLDTRPIKTPAGALLLAPTRGLAEAIAAEWRGQGEKLNPETMPLTKALNTALDRVSVNRNAIVTDLAKYAGADLICYRADSPAELTRRQTAAWNPWLDWAAGRFGARLSITTGVTHVPQPEEALERLQDAIAAHDEHRLVVLHAGITITGSAVLGLAFAAKAIPATDAFAASQIDECFQAELWGRDAEAEKARAQRLADLTAAEAYLNLL